MGTGARSSLYSALCSTRDVSSSSTRPSGRSTCVAMAVTRMPSGQREGRSYTSGLSSLIKDHLAGGASRLAALLLPQILPVFSVVAPCHAGAALRDLVLVQRGQATRCQSGDS